MGDWEVADKEEQATWERLVQRLWDRGVKLERGLQAIVRDGSEGLEQALDYVYGSALVQQRCVFHKLRYVSNKCVGLDREGKKALLEQAAVVYQAMMVVSLSHRTNLSVRRGNDRKLRVKS